MQGQDATPISSSGGDRVLSFGPMRIHNAHVQIGQPKASGCGVCSQGLESIMAAAPVVQEKPEVVAGDGDDKEGDASPPPGYRPDY